MENKENSGITSTDVIEIANNLLGKCNVDFSVKSVMQCNSDLFLALFHVILGDYPPGAILESYTDRAKLHNVKCIIDSLADEYLHVDLSHIDAEDIVKKEPMTIYNLLEILDGLFDYFVEQISVDTNGHNEHGDDIDSLSDMAQQMVQDTIQKEIGNIKRPPADGTGTSNESQDTNELIALGEECSSDEFVPLTPSTASSYAQWHELSTLDEITEHSLDTSQDTITADAPAQNDTNKSLTNVLTKLQDLKFDQRETVSPSTISNITADEDKFLELPHSLHDRSSLSMKQQSIAIESDSGGSLTHSDKIERLNVELNDRESRFEIKDNVSKEGSMASVDVADGNLDSDDNIRPPSCDARKSKDWQALLTSLQQTVEESKKIREKYFSSLNETFDSERDLRESSFLSDEGTSALAETYPKANLRQKNVRFEDTISTKTAKELKLFQEELRKERKLQETKNKILKNTFQQHLNEVREDGEDKMHSMRKRVEKTEVEVKQSRKPKRKTVKRLAGVAPAGHWKKQQSHIPSGQKITKRISSQMCIGEHDLLPQLLEQFPGIELTPGTLNEMWIKQFRQIEHLTNAAADHKHKIRRKEKQLAEGHMKHSLLIDIMQRQHEQQRRVKEINMREKEKREAKRVIKDRRLHTARIRKYYRDYHLQMKAKMLRRRTKEERIFKQLFEEGLNIQKSRLRELRSYATEKRSEMNDRLRNEIASLENYYKDQFNMLAETIAVEKNNLQVRDKAQTKLLRKMKQGLRQKMESEIGNLQELIARDDEDVYYREVEADRVRRQLQLATYNSKFTG